MRAIFSVLFLTILTSAAYSQSQLPDQPIDKQPIVDSEFTLNAVSYRLFSTQNLWTFIKLDTRNGKMWQVHFSVTNDKEDAILALNYVPLISQDKEINGRFTLYPTENIYNFILLDQYDGRVWQVQWAWDAKNRFVIPIE